MMTPEKLDRRLGTFYWMAFACLPIWGVAFWSAGFADAPTWAIVTIVALGGFAVVITLIVLSLAQAWVDKELGRTTDAEENMR